MKIVQSIALAAVASFLLSLPATATNSISIAGIEMSARFPDTDMDGNRKAFVLQDATRYFSKTVRLNLSGESETNLVAIHSAAMVARNPNFEDGFRFIVDEGETNMVVSRALASLYEDLSDWEIRTNLVAKADEFLSCLGVDPVSIAAMERRSRFRHFENGGFRPPSVDEATDEDTIQALSEIRDRFDFAGVCMLELKYSEEFSCWTLPIRFLFQTGTNDFERAVLSTPMVFVDESWRLVY